MAKKKPKETMAGLRRKVTQLENQRDFAHGDVADATKRAAARGEEAKLLQRQNEHLRDQLNARHEREAQLRLHNAALVGFIEAQRALQVPGVPLVEGAAVDTYLDRFLARHSNGA